jgi:hypothetical protein
MKIFRVAPVLLVFALALTARSATAAPIVGQIDNFEDGTTQGWMTALLGSPNPAPPTNIATGGPAGLNDNYLRLVSLGGSGAGSRLTAANGAQWAGNYIAAGVTGFRMDVNNFSNTNLFLRLAFENPTAGPPTDIAFSTNAILLPAGSGWMSVFFPITGGALTAGLGSVNAALSNTTILRLYNSQPPGFPNPMFPIPAVVAQLGVDNIQVQAVPEPGTLLLLAGGLAVLRRRTRAH